MNPTQMLLPVGAMLLLTLVVMALMLRERIAEMKERRIHPQKLPSSSQMKATLHNTRAADNYSNLFEMPVLFYALCITAFAAQHAGAMLVYGAWLYVALRVLHSAIHIGYNRVVHRLAVFATSSLLLAVLWVALLSALLQRA